MPQGTGVGLCPCKLSPHSARITSQILNISNETSLELMSLSYNIQFTSLQLRGTPQTVKLTNHIQK